MNNLLDTTTMESYEKKYKEALERARLMAVLPTDKAMLEDIFPELAESEDERNERIQKFITETIFCQYGDSQEYLDVLDYLEKQKEQIPYIDFVINPHKGDDNNPYDMSVSEAQDYAIKRGFGIPFNDGEVYVDERHMTQTIGNILRWADKHPKKQKPAEWSEEDELKMNALLKYLDPEAGGTKYSSYAQLTEWYNWLKSLRPQPHWKPNKEQMDALFGKLPLIKGKGNKTQTILESLYDDLKKL